MDDVRRRLRPRSREHVIDDARHLQRVQRRVRIVDDLVLTGIPLEHRRRAVTTLRKRDPVNAGRTRTADNRQQRDHRAKPQQDP
jgi:hypothetical protein